MPIVFPRYPGNVPLQFDRVAKALLQFDQFDDWLPDPVYYQDRADDEAATRRRVEAAWRADTPARFEAESLALPRADGKAVPAVALPLDIRIGAHAMIIAMAARVSKALRRDKVYGFRFLRDGEKVFDPPGGELAEVFGLVAEAAKDSKEGRFELLDMVGFNASAQPERLAQTLQRCGARPDECNVLVALARLGGGGLPSVDDAFAYAYNFYLQPIDEELFGRKLNFFRYRDEYFVFDAAARGAVKTGAGKLGLAVKEKGRSKNARDIEDNLTERMSRDNHEVSEVLLALPNGAIRAVVSCSSFTSEGCTDRAELVFERDELPLQALFERPPGRLVDAVDVVPMLRAIHMQRRAGVLLAPPFAGVTKDYGDYQKNLSAGRAWLLAALETAVKAGSSWQAGWCAALLSDIGALSEAETRSMLRLLKTPAMKECARAQVRIALARSSTLREAEFWGQPGTATEFQRRSTLVAARHLSRRSAPSWNTARAALGAQEPELTRHLVANIQGVS